MIPSLPSTRLTASLAEYEQSRRRIAVALGLSLITLGAGALGYWILSQLDGTVLWSFSDCIYMTAITVTTVGYAEVIDVAAVAGGREWTMALLLFGITANLYVLSTITAFIIDGNFSKIRAYRRLQHRMSQLHDHYIVCGCGATGSHVIAELVASGRTVVAIDRDPARVANAAAIDARAVIALVGDATDDELLEKAAIERAAGLVAALDDDRTNTFVVLSARQHTTRARIVAKAIQSSAKAKLRRAGADAVISPHRIGGIRLASELLRPHAIQFIEDVLLDRGVGLWIEEAVVAAGSPCAGATLHGADIQAKTGALVLAIRGGDGDLHHELTADTVLRAEQTLIAIGTVPQIEALRRLTGDSRGGSR